MTFQSPRVIVRVAVSGVAMLAGVALIVFSMFLLAHWGMPKDQHSKAWWVPLVYLGVGLLPWLLYFRVELLAFVQPLAKLLSQFMPRITLGKGGAE